MLEHGDKYFYVHFLYLPKENEPKEKAAVHLVRQRRTALRSSQKTGDIGKSHPLAGYSAESLVRSLLHCSAA
jgi:hypothetical protein